MTLSSDVERRFATNGTLADAPASNGATSPARLLFINQHYWPDFASTGQHLTDLCEHLAAEGHDVHVLCSRGRYQSGRMDAPKREIHNGVTIRRLDATSFGRSTHAGRILDYASFYAQALWRVWREGPFDYVVTLTTPPLLCTGAWMLRRAVGQRYGIWSMDLHPEAEVATGMLDDDGTLTRFLSMLNGAGYRGADFVVDLGRHMKRRLTEQGVERERMHTIPVWNKKDEVYPVPPDDNPLLSELGLEDKFVVMYSGNAGLVHRFNEVLGAMRRLNDHPDVHFLFVGGGPRREEIIDFAETHGVDNFQYLDYFPREDLHRSLSLADVHLLTLRQQAAGVAVPGKLYGIMAAGRPVMMVGPRASEPAETITGEDIGRVVDPADFANSEAGAEHLAGALRALCNGEEDGAAMGRRGREAFLETYEQEVACDQWADLINQLSSHKTSVRHA
jgi:glycosyltransferase involved in cell wall biosynthesis